jgi:predicted acylesterase/phospholipase RssA
MFERKIFDEVFRSLFLAVNVSLDITMKDFYSINGIELHCFSTEINGPKIEVIDFSHLTHPDWKLLDVLYCSSCLPILFSPYLKVLENEKVNCYIDGGIIYNYPLVPALKRIGVENCDEIFGIRKTSSPPSSLSTEKSVQSSSSLFDYLLYFIEKTLKMIGEKSNTSIKNQIDIYAESSNIQNIYLTTTSLDERVRLIQYGEECWRRFFETLV